MQILTADEIRKMDKEYLTADEAARALGISVNTFYTYVKQMKFPVDRIGRKYRIHREPFLEYLLSGKVGKEW